MLEREPQGRGERRASAQMRFAASRAAPESHLVMVGLRKLQQWADEHDALARELEAKTEALEAAKGVLWFTKHDIARRMLGDDKIDAPFDEDLAQAEQRIDSFLSHTEEK